MKKILLGSLLILGLSSFNKKKETTAAFGNGAVILTAAVGFPNIYKSFDGASLGPFIAGADYQVSKRFNVGLQYAYIYATSPLRQFIINSGSHSFDYEGKATMNMITATGEYSFLNKGKIWLGSGLGFGCVVPIVSQYSSDNIDHSSDVGYKNKPFLVYRLRVLDFKARIIKNFGLSAGLGIGADGIVSFGANYTFTGRK